MNNPEDIVQIALSAYDKSWDDKYSWSGVARIRDDFELELRRQIMQISSVKKEHTYTVTPPNLMGTWTTGGTQTSATGIPPTVTNKEILHG
jgi:hypothetical protein